MDKGDFAACGTVRTAHNTHPRGAGLDWHRPQLQTSQVDQCAANLARRQLASSGCEPRASVTSPIFAELVRIPVAGPNHLVFNPLGSRLDDERLARRRVVAGPLEPDRVATGDVRRRSSSRHGRWDGLQ